MALGLEIIFDGTRTVMANLDTPGVLEHQFPEALIIRNADLSFWNPHPNAEDLISKDGSDSKHHNLVLLGEEIGNLLDSPSGLDLNQLAEEDPTWMIRLSLPFSTDYKDNIVSPGALPFPLNQEATRGDEPHTFETFGKATGCKLNTTEPRLASAFLSEMNTLFEIILAQNVSPQMGDASLEFLQQVQKCTKILDADKDTVEF